MPSMPLFQLLLLLLAPHLSTLSLTYTSQITLRFPYILHSKNRRALCRQYVYRVVCVCAVPCGALCALFLWMVMSTLAIHLAMELKQIHKSQSIEAKQIVNHRPASTMIQRKEERMKNQQQQQQPAIQITLTECCVVYAPNEMVTCKRVHFIHTHTHTIL